MYGLTQHTPATTSLTALSAASLFGFNQVVQAESIGNRHYQRVSDNDNNLPRYEIDSGLVIDSHQHQALNTLSPHLKSNDNHFVKPSDYSPAVIELSALDGSNGFEINGIASSDYSGYSVSGAGDVNGDGYDDIIIGAYSASPRGKEKAGESYVVFGKASGFGTVELSSLDGNNGFQINGILSGDSSGNSVSGAGDVNGDGYADIIIGAIFAGPHGKSDAGESYVVFGKSSGFSTVELLGLDGVNGFQINGISSFDDSGYSVSGAGDVNADGYDDIIIGAWLAGPHGKSDAGESYVVFGKSSGFSTVELSSLDGVNGFQINGIAPYDFSGASVSGAGDVNEDGYDDIVIGAFSANPHGITDAGQSYVIFGKSSGFGTVELSSLDGVNGFQINGISSNDNLGRSVSNAGDVNRDGYADINIGAPEAYPHGITDAGESYVIFGKSSGFGTVELSNLDGVNGFQINGISSNDNSGRSVSNAGDVNADGYDDIIIGAWLADPPGTGSAGESYVIFGAPTSVPMPPTPTLTPIPSPTPISIPLYPDSINVSDLNGQTGSVLTGATNQALMGSSVSYAGDLNDDAKADVIMGAKGALVNNVFNAGAGYVVFGQRNGFPDSANVTQLTGKNGFVLVGASYGRAFATSVSGAGDVNDDGVDDMLIGSPYDMNEVYTQTGKTYVVYGWRGVFSETVNVTQLDGRNGFALQGESYSDLLGTTVSNAGDVNRDGISDFMASAPHASVDGSLQAGKAYIVFGDYQGYPFLLNITNLNGTNGFTVTGEGAFDRLGQSLSPIGDVNGDGINDIGIGAPEALSDGKAQAGKVYVIFGSRDGFPAITAVSALNGTNGFCINGAQPFDNFGASISSSRLNNDRVSDIIIGAPNAQNSLGISSGRAYVFFGKLGGFLPQYNISRLMPEEGFILDGEQASDKTGTSVDGIGDFNIDGVNDILIGAPQATVNNEPRAGKGYVVFGHRENYPSTIALSSLDGNTGFTIEGGKLGDNLGASVSGAGDINQDGVLDVLVGAPGTDNGGTGYTALVYGGVSLFSDARQGQPLHNHSSLIHESPVYDDVVPVEAPVFV